MAVTNSTIKNAKKKTESRIPYYRKPDNLDLDKWQIAIRKQFGKESDFQIINIGSQVFFSDFHVLNFATKNTYKVSIRSANDSQNFCECLDFKTNRLGTCKHISAVFGQLEKIRGAKKALKIGFTPPYSSIYLDYKAGREVKIRVGTDNPTAFKSVIEKFFDENLILKPAAFAVFEILLEECHKVDTGFRCYPDALDFVIEKRSKHRREIDFLHKMPDEADDAKIDNLLKVKMFPYQRKGFWFAAKAGRALIADEMGLGKTIQAIAVAELYKQELGINKVLVVCPTSLKYQWKTEIEKFTHNSTTHVIEGNVMKRKVQYENNNSFYQIVSYHTIANDVEFLNKSDFDLVILDEAQRIKNWKTKVSQRIKKLQTPYAIVLTGTPLENKLEELYSIMQFIDVYRLGPMYKFLDTYQIHAEDTNKVVGYKNLHEIKERLADTLIRRSKKEIIDQLPKRMDKNLFVPMTEQQMEMHEEKKDAVAKLVLKWRRMGFLNEKDRQRLMLSLGIMRMVCDSTYILDQITRHDTKIDELMSILDEVFENSDEKVVVFSQWERMTRLVAQELNEREVKFEYLHGGIESKNRKDLLTNFANNPESRVFLSTDAGGVGLNLQVASIVINLDIPWNPAVLEQRIARIYRLGQERNVQVINLVSTGTIEHRMLDVLSFKGAMAAGVLDGGDDTIFMGDDKFKQFMNSIENLTEIDENQEAILDAPEEHLSEETVVVDEDILVDQPTNQPSFVGDDDIAPAEKTKKEPTYEPENESVASKNIASPQELLQNGFNFFGQLAQTLANPEATQNLVNSIVAIDETTGQTYLKIPVENQAVVQNALNIFGALFAGFNKK
jgi:superfamily II DNA or RNA helicase